MKTIKTDICVIGGGSGGLSVAAGAAQMGANVTLCEASHMGGDCLNYGCVPSKALIEAARHYASAAHADQFGIEIDSLQVNYQKAQQHVADIIGQIAPYDSIERFQGLGVNVINAPAAFVDKKTVQAGGQYIQAKYFVLATGSSPRIFPIEGLDQVNYATNETIFT